MPGAMARDDRPLIVNVFLSSPGDVPEERNAARDLLRAELPYDPLLRGKVMFDVTSWDDPAAPAPMLPTQTPQSSVNRFMRRPGQCHIVVVILAGRLGTPLDPAAHTRADGSPFPSGTVWEFEDALNASPQPDILLYRREDAPRDPAVEQFFDRFRNPDGSLRGYWSPYPTPNAFGKRLTNDVKHLLRERLDAAAVAARRGRRPRTGSAPRPTGAAPPPAASGTTSATPLLPPDRCLGRDAEIAGLVAMLTAPRPGAVVVLGGPGIGKTTLTRAVATHPDLAARFAERRWFVPLETATDAASLRTAVVLVLGGNPADPAAFDHALAALAAAPALLVLDNLETPYDVDTAATRDALRRLIGVPSVTLLCSYRGYTGPAAPAFPHQPVVPPLPDEAARRLFLELAPRIRPDDPHLAPFLRELGGVPLAIELLALRAAPHDALAELWDDWQRRGVELAKDPDLPGGRLTSLVRSIDLSWRSTKLHEEGRRLFRLLGALPAGMAREDRAAWTCAGGTPCTRTARARRDRRPGAGPVGRAAKSPCTRTRCNGARRQPDHSGRPRSKPLAAPAEAHASEPARRPPAWCEPLPRPFAHSPYLIANRGCTALKPALPGSSPGPHWRPCRCPMARLRLRWSRCGRSRKASAMRASCQHWPIRSPGSAPRSAAWPWGGSPIASACAGPWRSARRWSPSGCWSPAAARPGSSSSATACSWVCSAMPG
jgi:hypothetical protein